MRFLAAAVSVTCFAAMCACTSMQAKQPAAPPVDIPKKITVPVGKNWKVVEEPPVLTNERNEQTLPFQRPESVQPPGAPPTPPEIRKIEPR